MAACEQYHDALWSAAESGALPDSLSAHVEACPGCRAELERLRAACAGFAALREVDAPDPSGVIRTRLAGTSRRWWVQSAAALGMACVAAGVYLALQCRTPVAPPPTPVAQSQSLPAAAPMAEAITERPETPEIVIVETPRERTTTVAPKPRAPRRTRAPRAVVEDTPVPPVEPVDDDVLTVIAQTPETPIVPVEEASPVAQEDLAHLLDEPVRQYTVADPPRPIESEVRVARLPFMLFQMNEATSAASRHCDESPYPFEL